MKKAFLKASKGFTLIELLIVVAIIGILVGIGVPALKDSRIKAIAAKVNTITSQIATAKTRLILDAGATGLDGAADEPARFALIKDYLLVNGVAPADSSAMLTGLPSGAAIVVGTSLEPPSVTGSTW